VIFVTAVDPTVATAVYLPTDASLPEKRRKAPALQGWGYKAYLRSKTDFRSH
jgi:hypothetical protein